MKLMTMKTTRIVSAFILLFSLLFSLNTYAGGKDDPLLTSVWIDQFEYSETDGESIWALEADFWVGKDLKKLWFKTEIEKADGEYEHAELQALYSIAVEPYWDLQFGIRHDFKQAKERTWAVIGYQGLAPYYFEIDTALFIGEQGRTALRFETEYEMMLTQRWVLIPEIEVNLYGKDDLINHIGSGLSDMSLGLRLKYDISKQFSPYIGYEHSRLFGKTADFERLEGNPTSENLFVIGVKAWF